MNHDDTMDMTQLVETDDGEVSAGLLEFFGSTREKALPGKQKKKLNLYYFPDFEEWIMFIMLVGMRHAMPDATDREVLDYTARIARKMTAPDNLPMWKRSRVWVERFGMRQAVVRVLLELQRTVEER